MPSTQAFFRNGRWIQHAELLELQEIARQPKPEAPKDDLETNLELAVYEEMTADELLDIYKKKTGKNPGPRYGSDKTWLINKLLEYVK